jgi:hypothetical protein
MVVSPKPSPGAGKEYEDPGAGETGVEMFRAMANSGILNSEFHKFNNLLILI